MAGVLKLSECADEPLHRWREQLPILVQAASGLTVVHTAVGSQPGMLTDLRTESATGEAASRIASTKPLPNAIGCLK